jgi:hypothetical protein
VQLLVPIVQRQSWAVINVTLRLDEMGRYLLELVESQYYLTER